MTQHDALRMQFKYDNDLKLWHEIDEDEKIEQDFELSFVDLTSLNKKEQVKAIKKHSHVRFNLDSGPLIKAVYFKLDKIGYDRLLIVIHHLVIDGVSWRILLEDLHTAYQQLAERHDVHMPHKTTSFKYWAELLKEYAQNGLVNREVKYWMRQLHGITAEQLIKELHIDFPGNIRKLSENNKICQSKQVKIIFDKEMTTDLLLHVNQAFNTKINDLLLSALLLTFADNELNQCKLHVEQELHGRDSVIVNTDLSRTVGWFTSVEPLCLVTANVHDIGKTIMAVKELLRTVPEHGIGYGLLRYLSKNKKIHYSFAKSATPKLGFNYLGQFDNYVNENPLFTMTEDGINLDVDPKYVREHVIDIDGFVISGALSFVWTYSEHLHTDKTITDLANKFKKILVEIVSLCKNKTARSYTKSDFPLAMIDSDKIDFIINNYINSIYTSVDNKKVRFIDIYPLSPVQNGMLFHKLYTPESDNYFIQHVFKFEGKIDKDVFRSVWNSLVDKFEILRTGFVYQEIEVPLQYVVSGLDLPYKELDWSVFSEAECEKKLCEYMLADRQIGFDLTRPPLIRLTYITLANNACMVIFSYHHIVLDGWSWSMLLDLGFDLYGKIVNNEKVEMPHVHPYRDYIGWLMQQNIQSAKKYWKKNLDGFVNSTKFTSMRAPISESLKQSNSRRCSVLVQQALLCSIKKLAKEQQVTLSTIVQAAWALLLSCYSGEKDILYGVTSNDRPLALHGVEKMVGLMIATLPMRLKINADQSIADFLREIQKQGVTNRNYSYLSIADIRHLTNVTPGENLFDFLFLYENYPKRVKSYNNIKIKDNFGVERIHYKMTIKVVCGDDMNLDVDYDERYFYENDILYFLDRMILLLKIFIESPEEKIKTIKWLTNEEEVELTLLSKAGDLFKPANVSIINQIRIQAEQNPDKIALRFFDESLSYKQLIEKIQYMTAYFHLKGVSVGDVVGVCLTRDLQLIICLLSLLAIGAAYVPMDPALPTLRLKYILNDAKPKYIITSLKDKNSIEDVFKNLLIFVDDFQSTGILSTITNEEVSCLPQDEERLKNAAYILYTSGSTGKPKGVVVSQAALANFFAALNAAIPFSSNDVVLALTTYTFDIFGLELYWPLLNGAEVVLAEDEAALNPERIIELLTKFHITLMQATPVTWRLILNTGWTNLSNLKILCGGEALNKAIAADILRCTDHFWNMYGPTEATIWSTLQKVTADDLQYPVMPIGRPLSNTEVYVLDSELRRLPNGIVGELYIGGRSLAEGYWQRDDLTNDRFLPNPFSNDPNSKLYKTGDLVKWLPNGSLLYIARNDEQVKVHGFRIELSEIEACLLQNNHVKQCAVLAVGDNTADKHLIAYIVPSNKEHELTANNLRDYLLPLLPAYMLPTDYFLLEDMPLTVSKKIDKKILHTLDRHLLTHENEYKAPKNGTEKKLVEIWATILNKDNKKIGINDNFFDIGGDSISAIRILAKIQQVFSVKINLRVLFQASTIEELAAFINDKESIGLQQINHDAQTIPSPIIVMQSQGNKRPLFLIHPVGGTVFVYKPLVNALGKKRPIFAIQDPGIEMQSTIFNTFQEMAAFYVKAVKTQQPHGPYLLAGASFGANMAIEMARQLELEGEQVIYIGLIDGWAIYPAKVNQDRQWFEANILRQNKWMQQFFPEGFNLPQILLELNWHRQQLLAKYQPPLQAYPLTLFKSEILVPVLKPMDAVYNHWDNYTTLSIQLYRTPGDHETMLLEPNVITLAEQINNSLKRIED